MRDFVKTILLAIAVLWFPLAAETADAIELRSRPETGPFEAGDRFDVVVEIGSAEEPATNVFGVGLELHFDPEIFIPVESNLGDFFPPEALSISRQLEELHAYGQTLTEEMLLSETGTLATYRFEVRSGAATGSYLFPIENVRMVGVSGSDLPVSIMVDEVIVEGEPLGACCLADESCLLLTGTSCVDSNGQYQGDGTLCEPNPCVEPVGACCAEDGTCTVGTQGDCAAEGGSYQGDGTSCDPNPCADLSGACCLDDGSCSVSTPTGCALLEGAFLGSGTDCDPNPCPQPDGACCFGDGSCLLLTLSECLDAEGSYQGDGTSCDPNPCPEPEGVCCLVDGSCIIASATECEASQGTYLGDGGTCDPNPCPEPTGSLRVTSVPDGATIRLDGELTGESTPFLFSDVTPGLHCVEWFRPGHGGCSDGSECPGVEIMVVAGDTANAHCDLTPFFIDILSVVGRFKPSVIKLGNVGPQEHRLMVDLSLDSVRSADLDTDVIFLGDLSLAPLSRVEVGEERLAVDLGSDELLRLAPSGMEPGDEAEILVRAYVPSDSRWIRFDVPLRFKWVTSAEPPRNPGRVQALALPNPFQDEVLVEWENPLQQKVRIQVFDAAGREVVRAHPNASVEGAFHWDGRSAEGVPLPAGVYLYRISIGPSLGEGRLLLLKR